MTRNLLPAVAAALLFSAPLLLPPLVVVAGEPAGTTDDKPARPAVVNALVPLDLFEVKGDYVFGSRLRDDGGPRASYGKQDEFHLEASYVRRVRLGGFGGHLFLDLGAAYNRFDFGTTRAEVPTTLQSIAGVVGLEYLINGRVGLLLRSDPGVYFTGSSIHARDFDFPTILAGIIPIRDNFNLFVGLRASLLDQHPVLPLAGFVWNVTPKLEVNAVLPRPRVSYSFNEKVTLFVGGGGAGGTFVNAGTPRLAAPLRGRLNHTVINYSEFRAGAGLTLKPLKSLTIDLGGGYDFYRRFDYYRPGVNFHTKTGAPYAQVTLSAQF